MFVVRLSQWPLMVGAVCTTAILLSSAATTWWNTWEYVTGAGY